MWEVWLDVTILLVGFMFGIVFTRFCVHGGEYLDDEYRLAERENIMVDERRRVRRQLADDLFDVEDEIVRLRAEIERLEDSLSDEMEWSEKVYAERNHLAGLLKRASWTVRDREKQTNDGDECERLSQLLDEITSALEQDDK